MRRHRPRAWWGAVLAAAGAVCGVAGAAAEGSPTVGGVRPVAEVAALIDAVEPGGVVAPPAGVYGGNLVIRKSVVLDGRDAVVFDGGGRGTVIEIAAPGVTVRRCAIRGSGSAVTDEPAAIRVLAADAVIESNRITDALFGIDLREAPRAVIRGNTIRGKDLEPGRRGDAIRLWWSHRGRVEHNTVTDTRDLVFWYSEGLRVAHNTVTGSRYGLHFMYSHDTNLTNNDLSGNSVGIYLMYSHRITLRDNRVHNNRGSSGYGIGLKDCDDITVAGNRLTANRVGVYIDNSPTSLDATGRLEANLIGFNEVGLLATPNTRGNVLTRNNFLENEQPAATHGRGQLTGNAFASGGRGNYWSGYAGFDLDGDGVGDLPHEPRSLFGRMLAREPNLRLFVHSPAQRAIEFTARALPEFRPAPTLTDPAPLTRPVVVNAPPPVPAGSAWAMAALASALTTLGAAPVIRCRAASRNPHPRRPD